MTDQFEWDEHKAIANFRKRGITFEEAMEAIADPDSIVRRDEAHSQDEDRFQLIGFSSPSILLVVFAERRGGRTYRIISARRANRKEQHRYYEENLR
jgi:uncharacterized DUF497 family protein